MNLINKDRNLILNNLKILLKNKENRGAEEDLKE